MPIANKTADSHPYAEFSPKALRLEQAGSRKATLLTKKYVSLLCAAPDLVPRNFMPIWVKPLVKMMNISMR